jgi:sarcosine oxidase delta subunit
MDETEKISSAADVEWQRYEYVNENPKGTATKRRLTNNLIVFHFFQHSGSFLSNHVYKCNVLEADSE